ncbi:MAG: FosX/FosE/FosI family fosfomycin resistance hydrolase [Defluviitaleaceae bacterium]|nr:FosX/FosE/FosI family fosfomycin resistance hydrolase [Defluviitaleaceae bacterium]
MPLELSHITLVVRDLERSTAVITDIFGGREVYSSGDNAFSVAREKFFVVGDMWLALMEGEPLPQCTYNHIAFKIAEDEIDDYLAKIKALGLKIKPGRRRVAGEGQSIYFYDYDNHLFELHTGTLDVRLQHYPNTNNPSPN